MIKCFFCSALFVLVTLLFSCQPNSKTGTFGNDLEFLNQYIKLILLQDGDSQIIVSSEFQGRIFASTSKGLEGKSYGWFNKRILSSDTVFTNRSKVGGAGRMWFGPDQGPFTLFFKIDPITGEKNHAAPIDLDTLPFKILNKTDVSVTLGNKLHLENINKFHFYVDVKREIELLKLPQIEKNLNISLEERLDFVGYKAQTTMKNIGSENWSKENGLICLWELGCMQPTPQTTVVIPLKGNPENATIYFTEIDSSRIKIKNNILFYKADADYLNKIGTLPEYSLSVFGSYSPELNLLTIVKFNFQHDTDYVNAHPENIKNQYRGDVINIFNDGKWGDIGPFGHFYELETSSPAKELKVGESIKHIHETYHFEGSKEGLNKISKQVLGVDLDTIEKAVP